MFGVDESQLYGSTVQNSLKRCKFAAVFENVKTDAVYPFTSGFAAKTLFEEKLLMHKSIEIRIFFTKPLIQKTTEGPRDLPHF